MAFVARFLLTGVADSFTIPGRNQPHRARGGISLRVRSLQAVQFMSFSTRILLGLTLLLTAAGTTYSWSAAADSVDHYELAPSVMRANGQAIYPAGVRDPSLGNPPGLPPESAIPTPPSAGLPAGPVPVGPPVWSPSSPASPNNAVSATTNPGTWSSPAAVQTQVYPAPAVVPAAVLPSQASWYTRVEYFQWNERISGQAFDTETGALTTLGYQRQIGMERFRAELFGGTVHYESFGEASNTGYLGVRGEYEMVLAPAVWEGQVAFLAGLGSRLWIRDLHDDPGNGISGYQETWWTIYPYLGLETHRHLGTDLEFYSESRIGLTAMTYEFASSSYLVYDPTNPFNPANPPSIEERPLWPKPGVFANAEIGLRGPRFFLAARVEVMSWSPSSDEVSVQQVVNQPNSVMFTVGGRFGFRF
jgi:hypothetical protein